MWQQKHKCYCSFCCLRFFSEFLWVYLTPAVWNSSWNSKSVFDKLRDWCVHLHMRLQPKIWSGSASVLKCASTQVSCYARIPGLYSETICHKATLVGLHALSLSTWADLFTQEKTVHLSPFAESTIWTAIWAHLAYKEIECSLILNPYYSWNTPVMKKLSTIPLHLVPYFNLHFHTPIPNIPKKIMTYSISAFLHTEMNVGLLSTQLLVSTW